MGSPRPISYMYLSTGPLPPRGAFYLGQTRGKEAANGEGSAPGEKRGMNNRKASPAFLHESQGALTDGRRREENSLEIAQLCFLRGSFATRRPSATQRGERTLQPPQESVLRAGCGVGGGERGRCRNCWFLFTPINKMLSNSLSIKATVKISK